MLQKWVAGVGRSAGTERRKPRIRAQFDYGASGVSSAKRYVQPRPPTKSRKLGAEVRRVGKAKRTLIEISLRACRTFGTKQRSFVYLSEECVREEACELQGGTAL